MDLRRWISGGGSQAVDLSAVDLRRVDLRRWISGLDLVGGL